MLRLGQVAAGNAQKSQQLANLVMSQKQEITSLRLHNRKLLRQVKSSAPGMNPMRPDIRPRGHAANHPLGRRKTQWPRGISPISEWESAEQNEDCDRADDQMIHDHDANQASERCDQPSEAMESELLNDFDELMGGRANREEEETERVRVEESMCEQSDGGNLTPQLHNGMLPRLHPGQRDDQREEHFPGSSANATESHRQEQVPDLEAAQEQSQKASDVIGYDKQLPHPGDPASLRRRTQWPGPTDTQAAGTDSVADSSEVNNMRADASLNEEAEHLQAERQDARFLADERFYPSSPSADQQPTAQATTGVSNLDPPPPPAPSAMLLDRLSNRATPIGSGPLKFTYRDEKMRRMMRERATEPRQSGSPPNSRFTSGTRNGRFAPLGEGSRATRKGEMFKVYTSIVEYAERWGISSHRKVFVGSNRTTQQLLGDCEERKELGKRQCDENGKLWAWNIDEVSRADFLGVLQGVQRANSSLSLCLLARSSTGVAGASMDCLTCKAEAAWEALSKKEKFALVALVEKYNAPDNSPPNKRPMYRRADDVE
ncbi:unnamed protein product [Zymoseptoria tritici ST99CH_1A5]|uniref:Uncharacterized protein n=1 Tax=Zymoseptoria tritici ST99CH_1A5 TaxID=1276529 RepID=A0A1Y6M0F8_ZYMTR|nr:unnamed protein product [Zymoseptoria tritici ST99CH_1A5]